ncbi:hypothetical protein FXO38_30829 [Capsicum annuum]|nr:hypothetical protein FXO38_30829 [Capsicum annuum]
MSSSNPTMRVEYVGKPMTPKISGDSAVERVGSSNEDNSKFIVSAEEDVVCSYDNAIPGLMWQEGRVVVPRLHMPLP